MRNTKKQTNAFQRQFKQIGGLVAGAFATREIMRFAQESVRLAGELEGVKAAFDRLNQPDLLDDLKKATRGTISEIRLMQEAVKANNFRIPLEKLASFFEFATKRAAETGESVEFLAQSIIKAIGRKSALIFDNVGVSVIELQEEVKRVGDFGIAAGNIIERELGKMGEVAKTGAQGLQSMNAEFDNLKVSVGKALAPGGSLHGLSTWIVDLLRQVQLVLKSIQEIKTEAGQQSAASAARGAIQELRQNIDAGMPLERAKKAYIDLANASIKSIKSTTELVQITDEFGKVIDTQFVTRIRRYDELDEKQQQQVTNLLAEIKAVKEYGKTTAQVFSPSMADRLANYYNTARDAANDFTEDELLEIDPLIGDDFRAIAEGAAEATQYIRDMAKAVTDANLQQKFNNWSSGISLLQFTFESLGNAIVDFLMGNKTAFQDWAKMIVRTIATVIIKLAAMYATLLAITALTGGTGGFFNFATSFLSGQGNPLAGLIGGNTNSLGSVANRAIVQPELGGMTTVLKGKDIYLSFTREQNLRNNIT